MLEVARVVKKLHGSKVQGVAKIHPEMLKALDIVGLSWLTHLFNVAWRSGTTPVDWHTEVVVPRLWNSGPDLYPHRVTEGVMGV